METSKLPLAFVTAAAYALTLLAGHTSAEPLPSRSYHVRQTVHLNDIPADARNVRLWVSIPDDARAQRLLHLAVVAAPGPWQIVRDSDRAGRFLYVEVDRPRAPTLSATVEFAVEREGIRHELRSIGVLPLPDSQKALFADELRTDAPHMEVTDRIREIAREVCGLESNPVLQASKLLHYVANATDHYSKNPKVPKCGVGDAGICVLQGGGCCTDLHSLFIALARCVGIPARLQMGYRLQPKNAGVETDPGYRCWAEYFISGYGWIPADVVEADAAADATGRNQWFTGLTEWRVHLNEGRDFFLPFQRSSEGVNLMSIGYAEIDGTPVRVLPENGKEPQLTRLVRYVEGPARYGGSQPTPVSTSARMSTALAAEPR